MASAANKSRDVGITVYGATGYTGKYVCRYLMEASKEHDFPLRLTLAGRNKSKLESRMAELGESQKDCVLDIFVADSQDLDMLKQMAKRTRVVISCAGPFFKYSPKVVQACAQEGTDYVDITGEAGWASRMRQLHEKDAVESGARIIPLCGFDSIPSDIAVFGAVQALREQRGNDVEVETAQTWFEAEGGGVNGGTMVTLQELPIDIKGMFIETNKQFRKVPFLLEDPLILTHPTKVRYNPNYAERKNKLATAEWWNQFPSLEKMLGYGCSIPFFMAAVNAKVVHTSAIALNYGPNFCYYERLVLPSFSLTRRMGILSLPIALALLGVTYFALFVIRLPVVGPMLLKTFLPPGTGSSDEINQVASASVYTEAKTAPKGPGTVDRGTCYMHYSGDASNMITSQCVCEAALSLLLNRTELPPKSGFGSPAELLGPVLFKRFKETKVRPLEVTTTVQKDDSKTSSQMHIYA